MILLMLPCHFALVCHIAENRNKHIGHISAYYFFAPTSINKGHICLCQVETKNFFLCRELSPGPAPRPMAEMMPQIFSDTLLPRRGREQDVFPFGQLGLALRILKTPIRLH